MMENPGGNNLVEAHPQLIYLLDGKLVDLEIVQLVFALELFCALHACRTQVDAGYLSFGPT